MGKGNSGFGGAGVTKRFLNMDRGAAVTYLVHMAEDLNEAEDPRIVEKVFDAAVQWSDANGAYDRHKEIQCYELSDDGFIDGNVYGIGIEDDVIIFKEYRDAYRRYIDSQI